MSLSLGDHGADKVPEEKKTEGSMGTGHCIKMFNGLLADLKVYEQNLQGLHWLVKGPNFFALHTLYGDMYGIVGGQVDEVAEKIRAMGGTPVHCFDCFTGTAEMRSIVDVSGENEGVTALLKCIDYLIKKETDIAMMLEGHAEKGMPEFVYGGVDMLGKFLNCLEKDRWQLNMFLGTEVSVEKESKDGDMGGY